MKRLCTLAAAALFLAACPHPKSKPPPDGVDEDHATDVAPPVPKEIVVPADAPAGSAAVVHGENVEIYQLGAGALPRLSETVPVTDVYQLSWPDAAGFIRVLRSPADPMGAAELGRIKDGVYAANKVPGKGSMVSLIVDEHGQQWLDRCEKWGEDNPEEEGCLRHAYHPLPPGKATKKGKKPPRLAARADAIAAPASPTLAVRKVGERFALDCDGKALPVEEIVATPTWEWLSADPPIAVVHIELAGSGEGETLPDETQPYLLRGCTIDESPASLRLGPDGLWAVFGLGEGSEDQWTISWLGTVIGKVPGSDLEFAGALR